MIDYNGEQYIKYSSAVKSLEELEKEKDKEIERLNNIIKEAIEFIEEHNIIGTNKEYLPSGIEKCYSLELMEILQGSDKE